MALFGHKMPSNVILVLMKCMGKTPLRIYDSAHNQYKFKRPTSEDLEEKIMAIDELRIYRKYKFGIMYSEAGQLTENEILSNCALCSQSSSTNLTPAFSQRLQKVQRVVAAHRNPRRPKGLLGIQWIP